MCKLTAACLKRYRLKDKNVSTVKWKNKEMRCECEWDKGNEKMWWRKWGHVEFHWAFQQVKMFCLDAKLWEENKLLINCKVQEHFSFKGEGTGGPIHTMKAHGCGEVYVCLFLNLPLDGGEQWASHPGHLIPLLRALGASWIGVLVGPRAGLDALDQKKHLLLLLEIEPNFSVFHHQAYAL